MNIVFKSLLLFSFVIPGLAWSIDFEDAIYPELITSSRALAMGGAYIARSNDSAAAFYNPAGLGSVKDFTMHLSNIHIEFSKSWMEAAAGGDLVTAVGNITKAFDVDGIRQLLTGSKNTPVTSRFSVMPNITMRYFSAGFLYAMTTRATVNDTGQFEYADRLDYGPYGAMNLSLFGGVFKFGAMAILQSRKEANGSAPKDNTLTLTSSNYSNGTMINVTGGLKLTLPIATLPTFAAKMHNVLGSDFGSPSGAGAPDAIKQSIDLGFSITPKIGKSTELHLELNWRDFTSLYDNLSTTRKYQFGMELAFSRSFFFRLGYSDAFGSLGLGVKSKNIQADITTYARDLTTSSLLGKEDRRFAITISSGI